ncbi:hypothetical protein BaRGS_00005158 [Batillaria attramentaria]|uniref:Uncharacterized protein n=1 Tax=Batillaria attramentaria TaxID=370345 RepID=A0ABD0LX39_9CAEN
MKKPGTSTCSSGVAERSSTPQPDYEDSADSGVHGVEGSIPDYDMVGASSCKDCAMGKCHTKFIHIPGRYVNSSWKLGLRRQCCQFAPDRGGATDRAWGQVLHTCQINALLHTACCAFSSFVPGAASLSYLQVR